jgi:hypothetical protein
VYYMNKNISSKYHRISVEKQLLQKWEHHIKHFFN